LLRRALQEDAMPLEALLQSVFAAVPTRVDGTAVFLTAHTGLVPSALLHNLKHNKALHAHNLFLTVEVQEVPRVPLAQRAQVQSLGNGCWQVQLQFGFMDDPDVPSGLAQAEDLRAFTDPMCTSYFLSRDMVLPNPGAGMALWRQRLFAQMHKSASAAADFLMLPSNAVVEMGSKVRM
jgi:KUP system potassium uptake protein